MFRSLSILLFFLLCLCALFSACESSVTANTNSSPATNSVSTTSPSVIEQPQQNDWL